MKKDIFIGGAWPYANYYLHVGHLAALLPGDVLAKYYRQNGDNVIYVSGSDCHGTPITERAKKENISPEQIASHYHEEFVKTFNKIGFEYDKYSLTSSSEHKKMVQEYFLKLIKNGYIYEKEELHDYCETCHTFLSDREIIGKCPICGGKSTGDQCDVCLAYLDSNEVLDKNCKTCSTSTTRKTNKHLYFKLTAFEKVLQELIYLNKDKWRRNATGEAQKYIDMGLVDRAATRQIDWGVEVPVADYEDKRIYVWIEAVLGYLTAGREAALEKGINFDEFMNENNANLRTYYTHGKDNIPFHTTIFPALLKGLNLSYRLPDYIISSAYVNLNDEKMSKSTGNLITVNELLEKFVSDTIRFYFVFNGPELKDTTCSIDDMIQVHNKFLVGVLGNFVNRNLSFIAKKFDGKITEGLIDPKIKELTEKEFQIVGDLIETGEFKTALNNILEYISVGNKYYDEKQPWLQVKDDLKAFNDTTCTCIYMIVNIANLIAPILPDTANKIKAMLNLPNYVWKETTFTGDIILNEVSLLFEKIDDKNLDNSKIEELI
ncbi:MAG: methionine--tRNA ligase [Bacilli bacterium]|nr:methionine--tRNA ligase [Bacilli bacterium]